MGVFGAGNFDNDEAIDYTHEIVDAMTGQVEETVASEDGMDPDESEHRLMCNVELLWLLGKHVMVTLPEAEKVEGWKAAYLAVWDDSIDGLEPVPGFKEERRGVIVESFDRLIALCREQANSRGL